MAEENGVAEGGALDLSRPAGPFLREYKPTGSFRKSGARTTSVLFYRRGYSVAGVSGIDHYDKPPLARPHTVCEIAVGTFVTTLNLELPASGGATFFKAEVDIHWTVEDPHLVAVEAVTDIAQRLTAPTLERLREVSALYPVHQAQQANADITRTCSSGRWNDLGTDLGLRVRLYVRLQVDDRTIGHVDAVREEASEAELKAIRQERYLAMLRSGDLGQLSHMLAADPDAANAFLEKIRQEGRQDEKDRADRVFAMMADGYIHSDQIERQALDQLNRRPVSVQGPIGSRPARRAPQELGPARDEPFTPDWVSDEPPVRRRRPGPDAETGPEPTRRRRPDQDVDTDPDTGPEPTPRPRPRPRDADPYLDPYPDSVPEPPAPRARPRDDGWGWAEGDG
ncbi:hypothetical protein ACIQPT_13840 [Streptomyces sp. NPDC091289]|uniref:hypothetical protein n=1 Tax=Streptomyces sp. NPDC091289 TaxID=3365989 RepID=UPI00382C9203